jgi:hypothetical protein
MARITRVPAGLAPVSEEPETSLRWLLAFIERDWNQMMDLPEKIAMAKAFVSAIDAEGLVQDVELSINILESLADDIREGIVAFFDDREDIGWAPSLDKLEFGLRREQDNRGRCIARLTVSGDFVTVFTWLAFDLVRQQSRRLGRCKREDCGRLFVIVRREKYCPSGCARIERNGRYREKHPAKLKEAKAKMRLETKMRKGIVRRNWLEKT